MELMGESVVWLATTLGGIISNVTSTASVVGGWDVGGVVGISENGWIENATTLSTASVAGGSSVGGLVGTNYYGNTLIDSSSTASVVGGTGTGGAVGENRGRIENVRVLSPATVTGGDYVGGLVGTHQMWDLVVNSCVGCNGDRWGLCWRSGRCKFRRYYELGRVGGS